MDWFVGSQEKLRAKQERISRLTGEQRNNQQTKKETNGHILASVAARLEHGLTHAFVERHSDLEPKREIKMDREREYEKPHTGRGTRDRETKC